MLRFCTCAILFALVTAQPTPVPDPAPQPVTPAIKTDPATDERIDLFQQGEYTGKACVILSALSGLFNETVRPRIPEMTTDEGHPEPFEFAVTMTAYPKFTRGSKVYARQWEFQPAAATADSTGTTGTTGTTTDPADTTTDPADTTTTDPAADEDARRLKWSGDVWAKAETEAEYTHKLSQENQQWIFDKWGRIVTFWDSQKYGLAVESSRTSPGAPVIMWGVNTGENMQWGYDGEYIYSKMDETNLVLEMTADKRGDPLYLRTNSPNGGRMQKWWMVCGSDEKYQAYLTDKANGKGWGEKGWKNHW